MVVCLAMIKIAVLVSSRPLASGHVILARDLLRILTGAKPMLDEQLENELRLREGFIANQILLAAEANRSGDSMVADTSMRAIAAQRREIDRIKRLLRRIAA